MGPASSPNALVGQPPAAPKRGVNMLTLLIVAVACLLIGVGLTTVVILLTQRQ
jgi:hypothetical protein